MIWLTLDLLLCELMCIVGVYTMQEIDVFIRVELGHFALGSWFGSLSPYISVIHSSA
jgi:hypothetical protein